MSGNRELQLFEENRKIRYLRLLVDLNLSLISSGEVSLEESHHIISRLREISEGLFPGKGYVFDLVYRPRLTRAIAEVFSGAFQ